MSFYIAKTLLAFLLPPACMIILIALGLLFLRCKPKQGVTMIGLGLVLLYLASIQPVAHGLMNTLEREYQVFKPPQERPDAIVVLSGGVRDISWSGLEPAPADASLERVVEGVILYRSYHGTLPIVFSGGKGDPAKTDLSEARAMAGAAGRLGVPKEKIIVEGESRNTRESAGAVAALVTGKRIVLVTSAFHMRRAARMFEKQGFTALPAPCAYLSEQRPVIPHSFIPRAGNLLLTSTAVQEYLSRAWYYLRGVT